MPALTFDDLVPERGAHRRSSGPLTFDDLIPQEPARQIDGAGDIGGGIVSGLAKGVVSIPGLVADVGGLAQTGLEHAQAYVQGRPYDEVHAERAKNYVISPETLEKGGSASLRSKLPEILRYDPETTAGKAAETVASFAPGAGLFGGLNTARMAAGTVAAPGAATLAAQGANSVLGIEGTPAALIEGGAALAGGVGGALAARPNRAANAVSQAAGRLDADVYRQAQGLMDDAAAQGVRLTADEAIQHVTNGATRLSELRRVVENSRGGGDVLKPLMAERAGQVRAAGEAATDALGVGLDPTQTGLRINRAANAEIGDTQAAINAATRPAYQAAEGARIGEQAQARLMADPLYAQVFGEIRGNPALNRTIEGLPDDSVGVIDLVRRRMREHAENAAVPGQANSGNTIAGNYTNAMQAPTAAAEAATGGAAGPYVVAREAQARLRQQELEPLTAGPVGELAASEDAANQAASLFPAIPKKAGAEVGVGDAVRRVVQRDPQAAQSLIRGHVRSAFDEATQNLASGENQFGGSKFASVIAGNGQQALNLEAAVRALPQGEQRWTGFRRFLDVMEATGKRPQVGSATAFNQEIQKELRQGGIAAEAISAAKTGGTSLVKRFNDFREQMNLGANTTQIANLLTRPDAARLLGELARTPPNAARAQILALRLSYMSRQGSSQRD